MANSSMNVTKTLIIGLGSTGTRICDAVADRIRWELQGLERAPWVKMLCLETNNNEPSQLRETGDFFPITVTATDYEEILRHPDAYDEKINLSAWADMDTLRKLPGMEVGSGAGNIRMVGRLAFLYQDNYNAIKQAVQDRIDALRQLEVADAINERGAMADGSNPTLHFGASGRVRVIIAGTLCGGTCSGLASDFGYFMRSICNEDEKIIAFFTLPRHDLSIALEPNSNRYKRNAYCALVELNHYHMTGREKENAIKFPDGICPDTQRYPYDIPYLAAPRIVGDAGEQELNRALADRIFLNIFVPATDPFSSTVDAAIVDRENRAHVFCSFGLATVEFPAQQVMEACSKKLIAHALRYWESRPLDPAEEQRRLEEIGLTWSSLVNSLVSVSDGENLQQRLARKRENILDLAKNRVREAQKGLRELRDAFELQMGAQAEGVLPPGIVPYTLQMNRDNAAFQVLTSVKTHIRARILDYHDGPGPLRQLLRNAQGRLQELQAVPRSTYESESERVDSVFRRISEYNRSSLLRLVWLRHPAINQEMPSLREALESELRQRLNAEVYRALHDVQTRTGAQKGVLSRINRLLGPIQTRSENLCNRIIALANRLQWRAEELSRSAPDINGLCMFEPDSNTTGTVRTEYQRCLAEESGDPAASWEETREKIAEEVIRSWTKLADALVPSSTDDAEDWLIRDMSLVGNDLTIPFNDLTSLERAALRPFQRLTDVDVLDRWAGLQNSMQEAQTVARQASPFLHVSPALVERGGRSPVDMRRIVLGTPSRNVEQFNSSVRIVFAHETGTSPDKYRTVLLEEWYRFPLSGAQTVLGNGGICSAVCNDFPTFFTRIDVQWYGLSDEEVAAMAEAEDLVIVGVLMKVIEPREGALQFPWPSSGFGGNQQRRLPLDFRGAVQSLAREELDIDGVPIRGARGVISQQIEQARRMISEDYKLIVHHLNEVLSNKLAGGSIPGWHHDVAIQSLTRFCTQNQELYAAYKEAFPPDPATIAQLKRSKNHKRPDGGTYQQDGFYCSICGGFIGKDEQDAAKNGWRCYVDPKHYFGPGRY